ncbi:MAG TPA: twin-arginine translocation signal domain-containing protein [Polyangiaceae bacterium]
MKTKGILSRRGFLKGAALTAGAVAGTRLAGGAHGLLPDAKAATLGHGGVLVIYTLGGFNSIFPSFSSLGSTSFGAGMTGLNLGNGLIVDPSYSKLSTFAQQNMATVGTKHGQSAHDSAENATWGDGTNNYMIQLADALGGDGSIKAVYLGGNKPQGPTPAVNGTSLQQISDLQSTIDTLSGKGDATVPDRTLALKGVTAAQAMSQGRLTASPKGLVTLGQGYGASVDTLTKPPKIFQFSDFNTAYTLNNKTNVGSFAAQMAGAELMFAAGANVVCAMTGFNWDSHGDTSANNVRNMMSTTIIPPLNTFINRNMVAGGGGAAELDSVGNQRNITVIFMGDFARSLPGSDHQPNMSVTAFGPKVKVGTTGETDKNVGLPASTPGMKGLWSYLAAVSGVSANPFGANPHTAITK